MPDGYSSNLARCMNVDNGRIDRMESDDCHIFMKCLISIAFSSLLVYTLNSLIKVSHFFKDFCSTTLRDHDPPTFFDSTEHLPIYLASEA